jgi:hypothetical protein
MSKYKLFNRYRIQKQTSPEQEWEWKVNDAVYSIERYASIKDDLKLYTAALDKLKDKKKIIDSLLTNKKFSAFTYISEEDFNIDDLKVKKGTELKFVLGVVLEPNVIDGTTTDKTIGDIYDEEEVRKAAHFFMMNYSGIGNDFMHDGKDNKDLKIVESFIAPDDFILDGNVVRKGTWMMGTLVLNNDVWKAIKEGKITGYSIGGVARGKIEGA